jgi:trk system potassium uptake protein TrkH
MISKVMRLKNIFYTLGIVLMCFASFMLVPLLAALYYREERASQTMLVCCLVTFLFGLLLRIRSRIEEISMKDAFGIVTFGWCVCCIFGAMPYMLPPVRLCVVDALFESMSGLTTTGASIFTDVEGLPRSVLLWRGLTQWIGGLGILFIVIVAFPFIGSTGLRISVAEIGVLSRRIRPRIWETGLILAKIYLSLTLLEIGLLSLAGVPFFESVCHSFSNISTGGFSPLNGSIGSYRSIYIELIVIFFMVTSGINFTLYHRFFAGEKGAFFKSTELKVYIWILVFAGGLCTLGLWLQGPAGLGFFDALREGTFQAISIGTTTGFVVTDFGQWPRVNQFVLLILMVIGGCTGSTAGALKVRRLIILSKVVFREFRLLLRPDQVIRIKMDGEAIEEEVVRRLVGLVTLWIFLFVVVSAGLLILGLGFSTSISAALASLGNIGPGLADVSSNYHAIPHIGKIILTLTMLIGRLEIFTVLILLHPLCWRQA